jgi:hypothetical protein
MEPAKGTNDVPRAAELVIQDFRELARAGQL